MLDILFIDNPNAAFNLLLGLASAGLMGSQQLILDIGGGEQFKVTYDSRH